MKMYRVEGCIKCGHRLYKLEKFIIAHDIEEAIAIYQASRPDAKLVKAEYRHRITAHNYEGIWKDDIFTLIKNNS